MARLEPGDKAPAFSLEDQNGKTVKLGSFKGKKLLVYFYPRANTSGCTKQACDVRDSEKVLEKLEVAVVGVSPDTPERQKKFAEKYGLGFPLLADEDRTVAKAYAAWGVKNLYGKKTEGIIRSAFLIDEKGKVLEAWYKVKPLDMVPAVEAALKG